MLDVNMPCDGQELLSVYHEFLYMIFGSSSSFFVISTIDNATIIERSFLTSATNTALPLKSFATNFVVNLSSSSDVVDAYRTSLTNPQPNSTHQDSSLENNAPSWCLYTHPIHISISVSNLANALRHLVVAAVSLTFF